MTNESESEKTTLRQPNLPPARSTICFCIPSLKSRESGAEAPDLRTFKPVICVPLLAVRDFLRVSRVMPRLKKETRARAFAFSGARSRTLHSRPPLNRFQEIFHAIKTGRYPNRTQSSCLAGCRTSQQLHLPSPIRDPATQRFNDFSRTVSRSGKARTPGSSESFCGFRVVPRNLFGNGTGIRVRDCRS